MKKQFGILLSVCLVAGMFFTSNVSVLAAESEETIVTTGFNPYEKIEAENFSVNEKAYVGCNPIARSCGVDIREGGYIGFKDVNFAEGATAINIKMISRYNVTLNICVDSLDNPVYSGEVPNTTSLEYRSFELNTPLTGVHDVYFTANHTFSMDYWSAKKAPVPEVKNDLTLEYDVYSWDGGHKVDFKAVNNTDEDIVGWAVKVKKSDCPIDQSWCVNIKDDGDYYLITPLDWNLIVPAGDSIDFGINGAGEVSGTIEYVFVEPVSAEKEELALNYDIQNWDTGHNVFFKLTNNSDNQLNGWTLKIDKQTCKIKSSWGVNVKEDDSYYILTPANWNTVIVPHGETTFGIQGPDAIEGSIEYTLE